MRKVLRLPSPVAQPRLRGLQQRHYPPTGGGTIAAVSSQNVPEEHLYPVPLIDTHKVVMDMKAQGFTLEQSEAVMRTFTIMLENVVRRLEVGYVPRTSFNGEMQRQWSELDQMRRSMLVMEKTEVFSLKTELERAKQHLEYLRQAREADNLKITHSVQLDVSLLKGHVHTELQKTIEHLEHRLTVELKGTDEKMEKKMVAEIAQAKLDAYRTFVALVLTVTTVIITYLRFFPAQSSGSSNQNNSPPPQPPSTPPSSSSSNASAALANLNPPSLTPPPQSVLPAPASSVIPISSPKPSQPPSAPTQELSL
eukprot:Sspe_Gene.44882::Locus_22087_Transcript_1_1_Confidence_1.000_Length_1249::g.44882::m.44882